MGVKVRELLAMVPDGVLQKIGEEIGVDKPNQKLGGAIMYKLLLYTLAKTTRMSLRIMEFIYESALFQKMLGITKTTTRHSSISSRISKMNPEYFEKIFSYLVDRYNQQFAKKDAKYLYRFDSTIIGLSAKLFETGMNYSGVKGSPKNKLHLKISIGMRGLIPSSVKFYTDQTAASEDVALRRTIREATIENGDFVVFDRGLASGKTFVEFCETNITFITRISHKRTINILETIEMANDEKMARRSKTLVVLSDQKIQLFDSNKEKFFKTSFRLIRAKSLKTNEELCFLTNDFATDAIDITELYARRWDIEVFFRFIKQELNFKHFLARNLNGLKSYLYMVLIFAILLLIYKTSNNQDGYKIVKMYFTEELENEVIAEIVKYCGGDPQKFRDTYGKF